MLILFFSSHFWHFQFEEAQIRRVFVFKGPVSALQKVGITSKATVNDARYKVSRIVKLVEIVEIKVDCHFYFYYALVGLYSANFFC